MHFMIRKNQPMLNRNYIKIHFDIYGSVVTLREPGEGVKVIGNGEGHVRYSSVAIEQAMQSVSSYLEVLSWRDVR